MAATQYKIFLKSGKTVEFATQQEFASACGLSKDQLYRRLKKASPEEIYVTYIANQDTPDPNIEQEVKTSTHTKPKRRNKKHYDLGPDYCLNHDVYPCPEVFVRTVPNKPITRKTKFYVSPANSDLPITSYPYSLWIQDPYVMTGLSPRQYMAVKKELAAKAEREKDRSHNMPWAMRNKDEANAQLKEEIALAKKIIEQFENKVQWHMMFRNIAGAHAHIYYNNIHCKLEPCTVVHKPNSNCYDIYLDQNNMPYSPYKRVYGNEKTTANIFDLIEIDLHINYHTQGRIKYSFLEDVFDWVSVDIKIRKRKEIFGTNDIIFEHSFEEDHTKTDDKMRCINRTLDDKFGKE